MSFVSQHVAYFVGKEAKILLTYWRAVSAPQHCVCL